MIIKNLDIKYITPIFKGYKYMNIYKKNRNKLLEK